MIQRIALVILLMCALAVGVLAATFGVDSVGATSRSIEGAIRCSKATPTTNGTTTDITWYTSSSGTENSKAAIYTYTSDTEGGALLAESSEDAGAADDAWRTGTITLAITASTNYYLCGWSASGAGTNVMKAAAGGVSILDNAAYGTWPSEFAEESAATDALSIYVTYTETSTGAPRIIGGLGLIE